MNLHKRIMHGLGEALEHAKGNVVPGMKVHVPTGLDVAAIRKRAGLSQDDFANTIGVRASTLKNWEQHRRQPEGPARVLLAMLDKNPRIVVELLGVSGPELMPSFRRKAATARSTKGVARASRAKRPLNRAST
jgi:putative transcriptional regulator